MHAGQLPAENLVQHRDIITVAGNRESNYYATVRHHYRPALAAILLGLRLTGNLRGAPIQQPAGEWPHLPAGRAQQHPPNIQLYDLPFASAELAAGRRKIAVRPMPPVHQDLNVVIHHFRCR